MCLFVFEHLYVHHTISRLRCNVESYFKDLMFCICRFGTFLCNCDKERHDISLYARSPSLWAHLMADKEPLLNPDFSPKTQVSSLLSRVGVELTSIGPTH